jgi:hypothetical protein
VNDIARLTPTPSHVVNRAKRPLMVTPKLGSRQHGSWLSKMLYIRAKLFG